jgi:hypothetical protein
MNRFVKLLGIAGCGVVASASPALAGPGTGDASVKILKSITVTKTSDLYFGKVLPSGAAATVAIADNGARTCGAGLSCYDTTTAGGFNVTGTSGETVSVKIDNPSIKLSDGSGNAMGVTLSTSTSSMTLTGGAGTFKVAGVLSVGANQAAGNYSGQYSVSVNYQ